MRSAATSGAMILAMTIVFFAYPIAAFMGHPNWVQVAHGAFIPKLRWESDYIFIVVGLMGTTITPVALILNVPLIKMLVWIQVLNGVLLPIILVFILLLINDRRLVGHLKNTRFYNILGWGTFAMITFAVMIMIAGQILNLFGIQLFGA